MEIWKPNGRIHQEIRMKLYFISLNESISLLLPPTRNVQVHMHIKEKYKFSLTKYQKMLCILNYHV